MNEENSTPENTSDNVNAQTTAPEGTTDNEGDNAEETFGGASLSSYSEAQRKVIRDKGLKDTGKLIDMYSELEKRLGASVNPPKDDNPEAWAAFHDKFVPQDYGIKAEDEQTKSLIETAKAFKASPYQAKLFVDTVTKAVAAEDAKEAETFKTEREAFAEKWGGDRSKNEELIRRGCELCKLNETAVEQVASVIGTQAALSLFMTAGRTAGTPGIGSNSGGSGEPTILGYIQSRS